LSPFLLLLLLSFSSFFLLFLFLGADFLCLCPADKWLSEAAAGGSVFLDARGGMVVVGVCVRSEGVCVRQ
jgi:hypothetical protein